MAPARLLLLTGAPPARALDWTPSSGLLEKFSDPFSRLLGVGSTATQDAACTATGAGPASSPSYPSWRSIPLQRQHLVTGHSQDHGSQAPAFFSVSAVDSFVEELSPNTTGGLPHVSAEQVLSQFYEESYAKHNDLMSSQLAALSDTGSFVHSSESSRDASGSSIAFQPKDTPRTKDIPPSGNLSDLKDIPHASYLDAIQPQTMTVNIIVGIISIQLPRAIRTRRGADMQLIEVLVGDETRSGFCISFWIPGSLAVSSMKNTLNSLRSQDVVLMRNIALNSFRGQVYGQSLRRDLTKVHLLYRARTDRTDAGGCYSSAELASAGNFESPVSKQVEKTAKTRQWCLKFLRSKATRIDAEHHPSVTKDSLPPDTQ